MKNNKKKLKRIEAKLDYILCKFQAMGLEFVEEKNKKDTKEANNHAETINRIGFRQSEHL